MTNEQKRQIATIDFESDPFKYGRFPKAFAVGFYDGSSYKSCWGSHATVCLWAVKVVKAFDGLVYAHNGGRFDFIAFLLGASGDSLWGENCHCIGGRVVRMRFGAAELRDSYAILPAPLKAYDKGEISYEWFEKDKREKYKEKIREYLRRDCVSLHSLITAFHARHGTRALTAAGAAMRDAKEKGIQVDTLKQNQDTRYRQWYFGGLVLARKPGIHSGNFKLFDIKSAYPWAMVHDHCFGNEFTFIANPRRIVPQGFYFVRGKAGCFMRHEKDKSIWGGEGEWYVTGWELIEAKRLGLFRGKVVYGEVPNKIGNFRPYVESHFADKEAAEAKGDGAGRLISKIMLNSLYGKYAQNPADYRDYFFMPDHESTEGTCYEIEAIFDEAHLAVWGKPADNFGFGYYNVATAASITGFVRAMLMRAIAETDAYYCDTDSIICDADRLPTGIRNGLGGWALEAEGKRLLIAGKKLYGFHKNSGAWKLATKGCRITPEQLEMVCQGKEVKYFSEAPTYSLLSSPHFVSRRIRATATL